MRAVLEEAAGRRVVATYDTAGSARMIREGGLTDTAAIASARRRSCSVSTSCSPVSQDYADNITRSPDRARTTPPSEHLDKTTIAFALYNAPGALFKALSVFALRDIDLTKLESRPARGLPWEYVFFAELGPAGPIFAAGARSSTGGIRAVGAHARLISAMDG